MLSNVIIFVRKFLPRESYRVDAYNKKNAEMGHFTVSF